MLKKVFIVSTTILLFILIFLAIYNLVFKKNISDSDVINIEDLENKKVANIQESLEVPINKITKVPVQSAYASNGLIYFLNQKTETIYSITQRGTNAEEYSKTFTANISSLSWSPDKQSNLITTENGTKYLFHLPSKELKLLPKKIDYATWSAKTNKILYKSYNQEKEERALYIADPDGSNEKKLSLIPYRRVSIVQIPDSIRVAFWPIPSAFEQTRLFSTDIINFGEPDVLYRDSYGADFSFSPEGSSILTSHTLEKGGSKSSLGIMNNKGGQYRNLSIPTIISKTVWSGDNKTVYYAQPTDIPEGSVMPNDYDADKFTTRDTFWKVDVTSNEKERLVDISQLKEKIDATDLFLSENEDYLFFTNKVNGMLYSLQLK